MSASSATSPANSHHQGTLYTAYWMIDRLKPEDEQLHRVEGHLVEESTVTIYVNAQEIATLMCSPFDQETLALGFLYNEGVIASYDEVRLVTTNADRSAVDVYLHTTEFAQPRRMVLTSGCGGGSASHRLIDSFAPLTTDFTTTPEVLFQRMADLLTMAELYQRSGGIHTSVLCTPERIMHCAEDIGRHNTIDRLAGQALRATARETATQPATAQPRATILLASGRISSEMLTKARRMELPLVASRTSPTSMAVRYAEAWNICLVGYIRRHHLRIYTHPERLGINVAVPEIATGDNGKMT